MKRLTNSKLRGQLLNKAFTLIELLAVIIVLAVVAIVAVPIVLDVVEESRDSANKSTALNILDAGKLYYTESIMDENKKQDIGTGENVYDKLILNGEKPENGKLYISEEGKISLSVVIDNKCYVKSYETELAIYESSAEECNAYVGEDTIKPTISYEAIGTKGNDDWYISGTYVKINVHDVGSGIKSYKWCEGIDCEPTNEETTSKSLYYETSKSVVICAIATDNAGNESETCSETYNIDVDAPTAGTILVNGSEPTTNWYSEDLEITVVDGSDLQSGHLKTEVDVKEITESTSGTKVTVTTYDVAGNTSTREYELKLDKGIPTVTITKEDNSTKLTATVETNNILSNYTYRWYKENTEITGATSSTYIPTEAGKYKVEIITESGIKATSNEIEIKSYKVTYNTNGSNDVVESQNKVENITLKLTDTKPTKEGYEFLGWGTSSSDKEVDYESGSDYIEDENIELYAIWKKTLTATFISNGATLEGSTTPTCDIYNAEKTCSVTSPTITREGYIIVGYGTSESDTTAKVLSGASVNISDDTTYIALTKEVVLKLTETTGKSYPGGSNLTVSVDTENSKNYGSLTCSSSNTNVATCTVSGRTITMTPGSTTGSAVITVTESNVGKTAKYTFNNIDQSFAINVTFTADDANYYEDDSIRYWLNKSYYVKVNVTSDETISKIEMCTATTNTCDPTGKASKTGTSGSMEVIQESNNNRVCVQVYDTLGRVSSTECSEAFGLDTVEPTAGTILVNGEAPSTNWYNKDLTIKAVDGTDALSGHLSTSVDTTSITSSTNGQVVTVTTTDKAGNTSTRTYTLKMDKEAPTIPIITYNSGANTHVWKSSYNMNVQSTDNFEIAYYELDVNGDKKSDYTIESNFIPWQGFDTCEAGFRGVDIAGNKSEWTDVQHIHLDITIPIITITKASGSTKLTASVTNASSIVSDYTYKWYKGSSVISGATTSIYTPTEAGTYKVVVTTGANVTGTSNIITISSYAVNYDLNGGTGNILNQTKIEDITLKLSTTVPTKTGYTFKGWKVTSNGTSTTYESGANYTNNAAATLVAEWQANNYTCEAGYYLGSSATSCTKCEAGSYCSGGTYSYSSTVQGKNTCPSGYTSAAGASSASNCYLTTTSGYYIASANVSAQTICPSGYYCPSSTVYYGNTGGIASCPSGYGSSASGSTSPSNCYNTITVSYGGNGATSGSTASQSCNAYYGNGSCSITLNANGFAKNGYNFTGWSTNTSSVTHNAGTSYSFSSNTTLNAIWQTAYVCKRATGDTYGNASVTSGKLKAGDAFDCDVDGNGTYDADERFYYMTDLEENADYAVLLFYENLAYGEVSPKSTIAYNSANSNTSGPITAKAYLPTTTQWKNVSLYTTKRTIMDDYDEPITEFDYSGYAARFMTSDEGATASSDCRSRTSIIREGTLSTCPFLVRGDGWGYWLETTSYNSTTYVWAINLSSAYFIDPKANHNTLYGVRPVIEVKKTDIQY